MTVSMFIESIQLTDSIESDFDHDQLERELDSMMETLVDLTNSDSSVSDPSMGADFAERRIEVSLTASAESEGIAVDLIMAVIRRAAEQNGLNYRQIDSTFVAA